MKNALELQNISFKFKSNAPDFFKNLHATFPAHAIHYIKGKNGAGKSTLFRLIQGITHPYELLEGTTIINGTPVSLFTGMPPITQIKMVPQNFDRMIANQFSFIQNLQFANMPAYPSVQPLPAYKPLPPFLDRFGINLHQPVSLLSGGQRQILAILMALQQPTDILLLDEPTAALDEKNSQLTMAFLHDLIHSSPITIIIISHDRELIDTYATAGYYELSVDPTTQSRVLLYHNRI